MSFIKEYLLSVNEFDTPKIVEDKDAIFVLLVRLLLLEKGTFQSHPNMGIGIISKYRYSDAENLSELEDDIRNQIMTYIPELLAADISLSVSTPDQELIIKISVNSTLYVLKTDSKNNTISLSDL